MKIGVNRYILKNLVSQMKYQIEKQKVKVLEVSTHWYRIMVVLYGTYNVCCTEKYTKCSSNTLLRLVYFSLLVYRASK